METLFATITGRSLIRMPYVSQRMMPRVKRPNIPNDRSSTDLVRQILTTWGKKATVVENAANKPMVVVIMYVGGGIESGFEVRSSACEKYEKTGRYEGA